MKEAVGTVAVKSRSEEEQVLHRLRQFMSQAGLSQADMARAVGEGEDWVSRYVSGDTPMRINVLERFAKVVGVPLLRFFEDQEPGPVTPRALLPHARDAQAFDTATRRALDRLAPRDRETARQLLKVLSHVFGGAA